MFHGKYSQSTINNTELSHPGIAGIISRFVHSSVLHILNSEEGTPLDMAKRKRASDEALNLLMSSAAPTALG